MKYLLTILILAAVYTSNGQDFHYPTIKSKGETIREFVPTGWSILDSAYGDLNKDGLSDAALIIQHIDSVLVINDDGDTVLAQPRILLITFKEPETKTLKLIEQSNSFILMDDLPNITDPYQGMEISKGILQLEFQIFYTMGSWYSINTSYKFRYQQGLFQLIGANYSSMHRATLDYQDFSYNFITHKRRMSKGNEEKNIEKVTWKNLPPRTLKNFKSFPKPFTWDIDEDVLL